MISLKTQFSKQGKHNDGRKTLYGMIFDIIISLGKKVLKVYVCVTKLDHED